MKKKNLFLASALVLVTTLAVSSMTVLANNEASQEATTSQVATISIVGKVADTAIATITFPEGTAGTAVSTPYNNVDTSTGSQVVAASNSEPVVRLLNTTGGSLIAWIGRTAWTDAVTSEDYELVAPATTNVAVVDDVLNEASTTTGYTIATSAYGALYLEVNLSASVGKTGTSTLTIRGETP